MIIVAFSVLRFILHIGFGVRKMRNTFRQFSNNVDDAQESSGRNEKVFSKSDGEYVDFEEMPDSENNTASSYVNDNDDGDDSYAPNDNSRISDAEYEEID